MSYNRFDALSSSDAESVECLSDSPRIVLDLHNKNNQKESVTLDAEQDNDDKDFDASVLRCLCAVKWRTFDGKRIDEEVLKKYLNDIKESEGFDINHFPGYIRGITGIRPHFDISKDYDETMELATTAIKNYNKKYPPSNYKVVEIKKVNKSSSGGGYYYYITFSAVHVNVKNGSFQSKIYCQFAFAMVTLLVWICLLFPPYNYNTRNLKKLLLKFKSAPELKASEHELRERTADCRTFQAKVLDDLVSVKREVLLCRAVK